MQDVVVIGAGPYGLSIASHFAEAGLRLRAFGSPMQTWRTQMPSGMRLKSNGFASTLYDPRGEYPISRYCRENDIPYTDMDLPVSRQTFADYGQEFARRYVPMLEDRVITGLRRSGEDFEVETADGEIVATRRVICAVGITHYAYVPPVLATLPTAFLSHSSQHHDLSIFAGQTVAVVGGGASAADYAALLSEAGATTHLLTRRPKLGFHSPPKPRGPIEKMRWPMTPIGAGWKSVLCTKAPLLFHVMPSDFREDVTRRYLGPAPCWFVRSQVETSVYVHVDTKIIGVAVHDGHVELALSEPGAPSVLAVDHVVAATGYKIDLTRLQFMDPALRQDIRVEHGSPVLSHKFESTVSSLFFAGPTAANAFGPLLRFACGAEFTARRLAKVLH